MKSNHERKKYSTGLEIHDKHIKELAEMCSTFEHRELITQILTTVVKMGVEKTDNVDLKLINDSLKEMRYSFLKLSPYRSVKKVTVFGSARSKPETLEYQIAEEFARKIVEKEYMVITGAGPGVMEAGNKGAGREMSIGVNINLPFEQSANPYIDNDHKLINFKYFFTRKLIFIKESVATVICPGGFGTQDEACENITLFQTGKSAPRPVILLQPPKYNYWEPWLEFVREAMLEKGFISETDLDIFSLCESADEAVQIITDFYKVYHSLRNIDDVTVLRLHRKISDKTMDQIRDEFEALFLDGQIEQGEALPVEVERGEYPDLPRLIFRFGDRDYGRLKALIDLINRD